MHASKDKHMSDPMQAELYMIQSCPFCAAAREDLEWRGVAFVAYDVESDREAYDRMLQITGGSRTVPVIVEHGKPVKIGWEGRGCFVRA
jgi:glutaredoxin 3